MILMKINNKMREGERNRFFFVVKMRFTLLFTVLPRYRLLSFETHKKHEVKQNCKFKFFSVTSILTITRLKQIERIVLSLVYVHKRIQIV